MSTSITDRRIEWLSLVAPLSIAALSVIFATLVSHAQQPADRPAGIVVPFKQVIRAGYCQNATPVTDWSTPTTNPAVAACDTGTNTQKGTLDFANAATLSVQYVTVLPSDWVGNIDAKFKWFSSTTSGNVVWQLQTICVGAGATSDPAFNTASTVTTAAQAVANQDQDATITSVTITGCAAGQSLYLKVTRAAGSGSDTMAGTARLRSLELTSRRGV